MPVVGLKDIWMGLTLKLFSVSRTDYHILHLVLSLIMIYCVCVFRGRQ